MKWFKRKNNKLNQTTRLYSLYGESANLKYLEDKINNFQSADVDKAYVDNQDNNLSRKINANTVSIGNNVNSIVRLQNKVDNLPTIDTSKDYVDRQDNALSSRIDANLTNINTLKSSTAKLNTTTDQRWTSGNIFEGNTGFGSRINMNSNKIINLASPTTSTDATNKEYVDNLNWNNAKLSGVSEQRWTSGNIFDGNTGFGSRINMNSNKIINLATPTDSTDAATKSYVDIKVSGGRYETITYDKRLSIEKQDIKSGVYFYIFEKAGFNFSGNGLALTPNSNYMIEVIIEVPSSESTRNTDGWVIARELIRSDSSGRYSFTYPSSGVIRAYHMSTYDYNPGAGGTMTKSFRIREKCYPI